VSTLTTALLVASQPVRASQIAQDGFGPSFPVYANSGTGFSGPWTQGGFNAFASGYTPVEESLCYASLRTSGGSVSGGAFSAINGAIRSLAQPLGQDNTTVYISFLSTGALAIDEVRIGTTYSDVVPTKHPTSHDLRHDDSHGCNDDDRDDR